MKAFLRSVSMLSLLRMAAGMLMPDGPAGRLCDRLLGFMTTLGMLLALRQLLRGWMQ